MRSDSTATISPPVFLCIVCSVGVGWGERELWKEMAVMQLKGLSELGGDKHGLSVQSYTGFYEEQGHDGARDS
jgi:hypothetical protein